MPKLPFGSVLTSFPTITRPPGLFKSIKNTFEQTPQTVRQNATLTATITPPHKLPPASAYVHLPFCRKRCHYCDFPIIALGSSSAVDDDPRIVNYIQTLCREIKATPVESSANPPLETVFFGGGTPSLVPPKLVSLVLETLGSKFGLSSEAEISMEMDPGTFDRDQLREFLELGVNRVSLGVQAFQDDLLKACGRAHGVKEVYEAIDNLKACGVDNWSMDLISSLPHQTPEMWEESLRLTIQSEPTHVSVYDLQVEQGTKFGILYTPGEFPLPSEDLSAEFYRMASRMLGNAGYDHYEISSYCKSGYLCKHNYTYWKCEPFYGFGLGAASYVNGIRMSRPRKLKDFMHYVQSLENGVFNGEDGRFETSDLAMDAIMLALRTSRGLNLKTFGKAFGFTLVHSLCKVYQPYMESGHVVFLDDKGRSIEADEFSRLVSDDYKESDALAFLRLSDPDGFLLSNELISHAFSVIGS
ncbi:OLC1v1013533C1 [Oldenlandia corymbosa var. corymbosa]|uniref:Radical S-adenosyl methionine domain-containing protein 1, mitochondrial n=1 Tax=Oldenlandia corymbosa var. corymbosa TaxID=529605 RepID=A0AAV1E0M0_OLDCO|nr:OLC1v1013533C1 [Oldenlandia corymbosa var. corymbosa]